MWVPEINSMIGPLSVQESTEFQEAPPTSMDACGDLEMRNRNTNQSVRLPPIPLHLPPLPALVDTSSYLLMDSMYPSKLLRRKMRFFLDNMDVLSILNNHPNK